MLDMALIAHHQRHVMLKIVQMLVSVVFHHVHWVILGGKFDTILTIINIFEFTL